MFQIAVLIAGGVIAVLGFRVMSKGELQVSRNTWWRGAPVYAVGGGVALVGLAVVAVALIAVPLMFRPAVPPAAPQPAAPPKRSILPEMADKTYTRDEFRPLVTGKTEDEVTALLGPPRSTSTAGGRAVWHYRGVVVEFEPTNGPEGVGLDVRSDQDTQLVFAGGVVKQVVFNWPK